MSTQPRALVKRPLQWKLVAILLGGVIILFVTAWAIDGQFLSSQTAAAIVIGKDHQNLKRIYVTERIGNTFRPVPRVIPEQFTVKVRMGDENVDCPVDRDLFRTLGPGQHVQVRYQKHRLTGVTKALSVRSE